MIKFGERLLLQDGSKPILLDAIDGHVFVEHDEPVPFQLNGEIQPFLRKTVWVKAPGWFVVKDRDKVKVGIRFGEQA